MAGRRGLQISSRIADNVMGRKYNLSREEMRDYLLTKVQIDPVTGCWNWVGKKNTTSSAYRYWGVSYGVGENHLGKLLMMVRTELM